MDAQAGDDNVVDVISQHHDENGFVYYFNAATKQSSYDWEEVAPRPHIQASVDQSHAEQDEQVAEHDSASAQGSGTETAKPPSGMVRVDSSSAPWALLARRKSFFKHVINNVRRGDSPGSEEVSTGVQQGGEQCRADEQIQSAALEAQKHNATTDTATAESQN